MATDLGLPLGIVTFQPHPRAFFRPRDTPFLLMDKEQSKRLLSDCGADAMSEIAFNDDLRTAAHKNLLTRYCDRYAFHIYLQVKILRLGKRVRAIWRT